MVELWNMFMDFHVDLDPGYEMLEDAAERWAGYISPKFDDEDWCVRVALDGSEVVGYAVATIQEYPPVFVITRHGFLQEIAVAESHRKRGVGRKLVETAEAWLRSRGMPEVTVRIDERNPASKALFRSAGFEPWVVMRKKILREPR